MAAPSRPWVVTGFTDPGIVLYPRETTCSAEREAPCRLPASYRDFRRAAGRRETVSGQFRVRWLAQSDNLQGQESERRMQTPIKEVTHNGRLLLHRHGEGLTLVGHVEDQKL